MKKIAVLVNLTATLVLIGTQLGCTPKRILQFSVGSAGYSFYYEEATSEEIIRRGIAHEIFDFEAVKKSPINHPFELTRPCDFVAVPFNKGDRFELQHEMYVWDINYVGARNTLGGKRLSVSMFKGPYVREYKRSGEEWQREYYLPVKKIPKGAILSFKEHRSYSTHLRSEVPILCDENTKEEYILSYAYAFLWLMPKDTARQEDIDKLPFTKK